MQAPMGIYPFFYTEMQTSNFFLILERAILLNKPRLYEEKTSASWIPLIITAHVRSVTLFHS